nr:hypothetical protein [Tanacetum cinerariifolium]
MILNLTPNVENQDFIQSPSSDDLKEFLLNGYTGKLPSISKMRVDHMHQPWRIVGEIINKFLSDLQYQIDYRQTKVRRREIMPYLRFTKVITRYFMSQHKSISKRDGSHYHTAADDDALITDEIKKSEAYKMFFKYSTGLIPPKKSREGDITSMMDVPIQQDVPTIVQEPFHAVTVSVIPKTTQAPPSLPPLPATEFLTTQVPNTEAVSFVV